jgi:hypothetical protein
MRDPARKALYWLIALLAGIALIRFGALRQERIGEHMTALVPLALGFTLAPFGFVFLIQSLLATRGRARLLAGHRAIARWHVYPADWERFRELDARRAGEHHSLVNDLRIRKVTPRDGVEVIVGETSLLVDHSYHVLRPGGLPALSEVRWLDGPPACLEFALVYPRGRYGGSLPLTLRVPVPASALGAAQLVFDHFEPRLRRRPALALRNPPRTYRVCAVMIAAATLCAPAGYLMARALPAGANPLVPLSLLIGGAILAVFAAILALATFLLTWRA